MWIGKTNLPAHPTGYMWQVDPARCLSRKKRKPASNKSKEKRREEREKLLKTPPSTPSQDI
jgi:hypothetical protein